MWAIKFLVKSDVDLTSWTLAAEQSVLSMTLTTLNSIQSSTYLGVIQEQRGGLAIPQTCSASPDLLKL